MIRRMFKRTKHHRKLNRTRVQIIESVRIGKKVRQEFLHHAGIAHFNCEIKGVNRLAGKMIEQLRAERTPLMELLTPSNAPSSRTRPHLGVRLHILSIYHPVSPVSQAGVNSVAGQAPIAELQTEHTRAAIVSMS